MNLPPGAGLDPVSPKSRKERVMSTNEDGQSTVEYVLVVLAAAALAMALVTWIGGSSVVPSFFTAVMDKVVGFVR